MGPIARSARHAPGNGSDHAEDRQDGQPQFDLAMDIYETPDAYEIEASMPGIKPEDVDLTLNNNVLTIRG